jgi:DNA mismatch repair protein MSH5
VSDNIFGSYVLDARPSSDFSYVAGKNKLINLELSVGEGFSIVYAAPGEELTGDAAIDQTYPDRNGRQGRLMKLGGLVDLDSKLTASF